MLGDDLRMSGAEAASIGAANAEEVVVDMALE